ncbi:DUF7373 family lipoprotein [Nocardia thailandica]
MSWTISPHFPEARTVNLRRVLLTSLIAASALATACGSTIVGAPSAGEIDVRKLDVGKYPTDPLDHYTDYTHSVSSGTSLAVMRLADNMITGLDIDPALKYGTGVQDILKPGGVDRILAKQSVPVAERYGLQFGFASGSSDIKPEPAKSLPKNATLTTVTVMQFPTVDAAQQAAAEFERVDFDVAPDQNQAVQIPNHPAARAHWRPGTPTLGSTIAHGRYVISLFVNIAEPDLDKMTALVEKAYSSQTKMLDALPPLDAEQVLRMELDPSLMLQRILNPGKSYIPSSGSFATYTPRGYLHWVTDRADARQLLADTGTDRISFSGAYSSWTNTYSTGIAQAFGKGTERLLEGAILMRAGNIDNAKALWDKVLDAPEARMSPANVPDAKCAQQAATGDVKNFTCAVRYREYVGIVWGNQLLDAQQRAAAQYAVLANSQ